MSGSASRTENGCANKHFFDVSIINKSTEGDSRFETDLTDDTVNVDFTNFSNNHPDMCRSGPSIGKGVFAYGAKKKKLVFLRRQ